ncbi:MAG: ABC transporter ATP-binding protein [Thermoanaerobaculia bacterium]|nr:ABC transporter ATP-binding protein [Thermoanaerobaculia bacterium]
MPVLEVTDAARRYGEVAALCGVDLQLERGEWLGLLGPNGAGKTTLVRAIAGRVRLDRGEIALFGQRLGVVPQEIALYPALTARENLVTFGSLHGLGRRELTLRIAWALAWTGLAERADEPVRGFSGGMKRRLNIAASVLHRPDVLLLDEPTVGVDPQSRERIWQMLAELRRGGTRCCSPPTSSTRRRRCAIAS